MATVTFQTIVCDNPSGGLVRLYFEPPTDPNPFWQRFSINIPANPPTSLGNITRDFGATATVILTVTRSGATPTGASCTISSYGSLCLPFAIETSNFTVNCFVS